MLAKNPNDTVFYVYILLDPRVPGPFAYGNVSLPYEPFYVGKGKGSRSAYHVAAARRSDTNSYKLNKIRKILDIGLDVVVVHVLTGITEAQALTSETDFIQMIGRQCDGTGPLVNITRGGDGVSGLDFSEESRERMRAAQRRRFEEETQEERDARNRKHSETLLSPDVNRIISERTRAYYANNPNARDAKGRSIKSWWDGLTSEQREDFVKNRGKSIRKLSVESKKKMAEKKKSTRKQKGEDWERDVQARRLAALGSRSDADKEKTSALLSAAGKERFEKSRRAKISEESEAELRSLYESGEWAQGELAEKYGINRWLVRGIVNNKYGH
jgi:hypothetical protein